MFQFRSVMAVSKTAPVERHAVHVPDRVLTGCGVSPEEVGLAITVEVAHPHNVPVQIGDGIEAQTPWLNVTPFMYQTAF